MSNGTDNALVWIDEALGNGPGTHVLIVGVGAYAFGKGTGAASIAADLRQLSSPPISARAIATWFIDQFSNSGKPLASVSMLISEPAPAPFTPSRPAGAAAVTPPPATLANLRAAALKWHGRVATNPANMAVFYFCGHGISKGQQAAMLLEDFGDPAGAFDGAINLDALRGTMKNSPAIQQLYLLDCCRTNADELYENEDVIGSRILSVTTLDRGHSDKARQCILFPTLGGEEAFGIRNSVSAFTQAVIDAMSFAAADPSSGVWQTTTGRIVDTVSKLMRVRVARLTGRSTPQAPDLTSFDFNEIAPPTEIRSFVTLSDLQHWGNVELECLDPAGAAPPQRQHSRDVANETCVTFRLKDGQWRFTGSLPNSPPHVQSRDQFVRTPVAFVSLDVTP